MKRLFFVCLSLLLCLGFMAVLAEETACTEHNYSKLMYDAAQHWYACEVCEAEQENSRATHYAACTNEGVCVVCSYEDAEMGIADSLCDFSVWKYFDKDYHAWACSKCGVFYYDGSDEMEKQPHSRDCDEDACWCGATECNFDYIWHDIPDPLVWEDLGDTHAVPCARGCGGYDEQSIEVHKAVCTDRSVCYTCGHANPENVWHRNMSSTWTNLGTTHGKYCSDCQTYVDEGAHQASCSDPTTCTVCGATDVVCEIGHNGEIAWRNDGDTHTSFWSCCSRVNTEGEKHLASCAAPDKCVACGAEGEGFQLTHTGETIWNNDETTHWLVWNCCSTKSGESSAHIAACTDKTTCIFCKAENITANVTHNTEYKIWNDEDVHWNGCVDCGNPVGDKIKHYVSCDSTDRSVCSVCGIAVDPDTVAIAHEDIENPEVEYDENNHWRKLCACGESFEMDTHWASCAAPDAGCAVCGYTGSDMPVYHALGSATYIDEQYHEEACARCDHKQIEAHWSSSCLSNICEICEAEFANTNPNHSWADDSIQSDADNHWYICLECNEDVELTAHTDVNKDDQCDVCKAQLVHKHSWGEPVTVPATCTADGSKTITCAGCGEKTVETIASTGHAWGEPVIVDATCTKDGSKTTTCGACGEKTVETIVATGHSWGEPVVVEATCTADGSKTTTCGACGEKTVETIAATGHSWGEPVIVDATCTKDGSKTTTCGACGEKTVETIKATGHSWGEPVIVEATCTADGSKTTTCGACGEKTVETIKATGHSWVEPVVVDATCTADGSKTTTCANCGEKTVETIAATGHSWGEPVTVPATCTADGSKTTTCANCGEKTVETIAATGHAWGEPVIVDATCTADGSKTTTCGACGEKTVETIAATGHAWGEPVIVDATCTADGSKTTTCANCGEKTVETIKATGHAWGEPVIVDATCTADGSKTTTCANCGEKTVETIKATGHAWGEPVTVPATCTADGSKTTTCATCDEEIVEVIPSLGGHKWKTTENKAATCTEKGRVEKRCSVCNTYTVSTSAAKGHAWNDPVTVAATCTADGSKTIACANCDEKTVEVIAATGHAWGEPVTIPATCTADGSTTITCTTCGEKNVESLASTGHAYGLVYTTQGNGTHAKTCSVCGAIQSAKCSLTTTNMGSMTCSACATCGYTVYTFNEVAAEKEETTQAAADANANASTEKTDETAPVVTEAKAETVVKRVENVSFELLVPIVEEPKENAAEEDAAAETVEPDASTEAVVEAETKPEAPADHSEVVLVVHETKVEMKVELPDTVTAEVKKVLAVSLLKEGNAIQPAATVKLSIPVVEEEVTGLKLMLMTDSGELVEVEYEIVDGVIVFATDMVGVFLFVDAEA